MNLFELQLNQFETTDPEFAENLRLLKDKSIWNCFSEFLNLIFSNKDCHNIKNYSVIILRGITSLIDKNVGKIDNKMCLIHCIHDFLVTCPYMLRTHMKFRSTFHKKMAEFLSIEKLDLEDPFELPSIWIPKYWNYIFKIKIKSDLCRSFLPNFEEEEQERSIMSSRSIEKEKKIEKICSDNDELSAEYLVNSNKNNNKPTSIYSKIIQNFVDLNKTRFDIQNINFIDDIINDEKNLWILDDVMENNDTTMKIYNNQNIIIPPSSKIIVPKEFLKNQRQQHHYPYSSHSPSPSPLTLPKNLDDFTQRLSANGSIMIDLIDFDLQNNMVIAGGSLSHALLNTHCSNQLKSDIDIFFYNFSVTTRTTILPQQQTNLEIALKHAERLRQHLTQKWGSYNLRIFVSHYCITFYNTLTGRQIQLILCDYDSILSILNDFDLGSCCVAWDGKNLFFNSNGKFAYEYGLNIISLKNYRESYEFRIEKYFARGFGLLFPSLTVKPRNIIVEENVNNRYGKYDMINIGNLYIHFDPDDYDQSKNRIITRTYLMSVRKFDNNNNNDDNNIQSEYATVAYCNIEEIYWRNFSKIISPVKNENSIQKLVGFVDNKDFIDFQSTRKQFLSNSQLLSSMFERRLRTENGLSKILHYFKKDQDSCIQIMKYYVMTQFNNGDNSTGSGEFDWIYHINKLIPEDFDNIKEMCIIDFRSRICQQNNKNAKKFDEISWYKDHYLI
jgi:hypothetical protein